MTIQRATTEGHAGLSWLADAARAGEIHTVRVGWSDRLGAWRGKRVPVADFVANPERRIGFCDGMIIVDVQSGIIEATPFSNFSTGYPDMYLRPDLETLNRVGWASGEAFVLGELQEHHGASLDLMPRVMLDGIVDRLASSGVELAAELSVSGRLMTGGGASTVLDAAGRAPGESGAGLLRAALAALSDSGVAASGLRTASDGRFCVALAPLAARAAGEAAFLTKAALKEIAQEQGLFATFMTVSPGMTHPSLLGLRLIVAGTGELAPLGAIRRRLNDIRALFQPSVNAFKAGAADVRRDDDTATCVTVTGLSSEADPLTALACVLAAVFADGGARSEASPYDLASAAERLRRSEWAVEWLGERFLDNSIELLHHEAQQYAAAVTDWEVERYWRQG